jgi:hypothetical protein
VHLFDERETTSSLRVENLLGSSSAAPCCSGNDVPGKPRQVFVTVDQAL